MGDKFSYDNTTYVGSRDNIIVYCKKCNNDITVKPYHFIDRNNPTGCKKCQYSRLSQNTPQTTAEFVEKATKIHGSKYSYENSNYISSRKTIDIKCNTCNSTFSPIANNHISKPKPSGCPNCCKFGFDKNKPAILYYLKVTNDSEILYKVGITNRTVTQRFTSSDLSKIEVVSVTEYAIGTHAYNEEQKILKEYKNNMYTGPEVLSSGNTELFTSNILGL